jgi:hypothetical protein
MLLPDGRVVAAGGDSSDSTDTRGSGRRKTYEVYHPPYLFVDDGGVVPTPVSWTLT